MLKILWLIIVNMNRVKNRDSFILNIIKIDNI